VPDNFVARVNLDQLKTARVVGVMRVANSARINVPLRSVFCAFTQLICGYMRPQLFTQGKEDSRANLLSNQAHELVWVVDLAKAPRCFLD
jgi:hypothetical protein